MGLLITVGLSIAFTATLRRAGFADAASLLVGIVSSFLVSVAVMTLMNDWWNLISSEGVVGVLLVGLLLVMTSLGCGMIGYFLGRRASSNDGIFGPF